MRILWLVFVLLFNFHPEKKLVIHEKEITVAGNTTLGKFDCTYKESSLKDTLSFVNNVSQDAFLFHIDVTAFACGNPILNNDFKKTIRAKEFPQARVIVTNLKKVKPGYQCDLHLEIAGKRLFFQDFLLNSQNGKLTGWLDLHFASLGLVPPKKFGGLIKVDEVLSLSLSMKYTEWSL
jgi:hypothetical protein